MVGVPGDGSDFMPKEVQDAEGERRREREARLLYTALATEADRQVRLNSVARDFTLDLPKSVPQPDGEEFPRRYPMQFRSDEQVSQSK